MVVYEAEINGLIRGFMRLWARFGALLPNELAKIHDSVKNLNQEDELQPATNYELFYRVSNVILDEDSLTMSELSNAIAVPMSTATRIADWLVDSGYVQRLPDYEDRRVVRVALTKSGKELHKTVENFIIQRLQQILSGLTDEERATVFEHVFEITSILKKVIK